MKRLEDAGQMIFMRDSHRAHIQAFETSSYEDDDLASLSDDN